MNTLTYNIEINAPARQVWFALWDPVHYSRWTSAFSEGSHAVSDWKEGSRIHFLSPSGEGIYANIALLVPNEKMYFRHEGIVKNFKEQPDDEAGRKWSGAMEKYELTVQGDKTILTVHLDTLESYQDYFNQKFPAALKLVKQDAEHLEIIIQANVHVPVETAWKLWTDPADIVKWNSASDDWHTPKAENNLVKGGRFLARMEAKDGSFGFDFGGVYHEVITYKTIAYTLDDGRKVRVDFVAGDNQTEITESFEPEDTNSMELQKTGWQAILNSFKRYAEGQG